MTDPIVDPSQIRLERDLLATPVQAGVDVGLWRIEALVWPALFVSVVAGDGNHLTMRLAVDRYPALAPAGQPWDLEADSPLTPERWPIGGTAPQIFRRDWSVQNGNAPYMACDRVGLSTHANWATEHPKRAWTPSRTIDFYFAEIHLELQGATMPSAA